MKPKKITQKDPGRYSTVLFLVGLNLALLMVLGAFQIKNYEEIPIKKEAIIISNDSKTPIYEVPKPEIPKPLVEPPKPELPDDFTEIEQTEVDIETTEIISDPIPPIHTPTNGNKEIKTLPGKNLDELID